MCISILHPPVDDPQSGELPCERWNPTQSVRSVEHCVSYCVFTFSLSRLSVCFLAVVSLQHYYCYYYYYYYYYYCCYCYYYCYVAIWHSW